MGRGIERTELFPENTDRADFARPVPDTK